MEKACQDFANALHTFVVAINGSGAARTVEAPAEKKSRGATKAEASAKPVPVKTVDEVKEMARTTAKKISSSAKVKELLATFGGSSVAEIPKENLDKAFHALEGLLETHQSAGANEDF